jgi:hypothetical protein
MLVLRQPKEQNVIPSVATLPEYEFGRRKNEGMTGQGPIVRPRTPSHTGMGAKTVLVHGILKSGVVC